MTMANSIEIIKIRKVSPFQIEIFFYPQFFSFFIVVEIAIAIDF